MCSSNTNAVLYTMRILRYYNMLRYSYTSTRCQKNVGVYTYLLCIPTKFKYESNKIKLFYYIILRAYKSTNLMFKCYDSYLLLVSKKYQIG